MKKTLATLLSLFCMVAFSMILISGEETSCLYQPSLTELQPQNIRFQVYHYVNNNIECDPWCNHSCATSDGTITVEVFDDTDTSIAGPYDMTMDDSDDCYTHWKRDVTDDLTGADYAEFVHVSTLGCSVKIYFP